MFLLNSYIINVRLNTPPIWQLCNEFSTTSFIPFSCSSVDLIKPHAALVFHTLVFFSKNMLFKNKLMIT